MEGGEKDGCDSHHRCGKYPIGIDRLLFWLIEQSIQKRADKERKSGKSGKRKWMPERKFERRMNSASSTVLMLP